MNEALLGLTKSSLLIENNSVKYYAIQTLMRHGIEVDHTIIEKVAKSEIEACSLYDTLDELGKSSLFPAELRTQQYLAKSDMIRWLTFPTELGKIPDEIEFVGTVKKTKEIYYVFRFRDNSDSCYKDWMIGWAGGYSIKKLSGNGSSTFSHFEKESDIRMPVLKYVKKCLK